MNAIPFLLFAILIALAGCNNSFEKRFDCSLKENQAEKSQHFNILFLGNNIIAEYNVPGMVRKLAKSMGDSLFYLTMAPYDYNFEQHFENHSTRAMINDFEWDYVVLQESGWQNALPTSMADSMSFCWADSIKQYIKVKHPNTQLMLFMTEGFVYGVKTVDADWADTDPEVSYYEGMQERIKQNCLMLASKLDAEIAPCGIIWKICTDMDPALDLFRSDNMNPNIKGSYLCACTLYSSIFRKKLKSAYYPVEIKAEEATFFQYSVSEALFECNPDWRDY